MKRVLIVMAVVMFGFNAFGFEVSNIVCGLGVKNRRIIKPLDEFKVGDRVYCLTVLKDIDNESYIIHRWVFNDRHLDVKLKIKPYRRFRTWSYKTIYPSMKGVWKFEVVDSRGNLIREKVFVVK